MILVLVSGPVPLASPITWNVVDDHEYVKDPFFDDNPRAVMENKQFNSVPTMIGVNKQEGLLFTSIFYALEENLKFLQDNWEMCVVSNFIGKFFLDKPFDEKIKDKVKKITEFYFGDQKIDMNTFENLTNLYTDPGFLYGTDVLARYLQLLDLRIIYTYVLTTYP